VTPPSTTNSFLDAIKENNFPGALLSAAEYAVYNHHGQTRATNPYSLHCLRVARLVTEVGGCVDPHVVAAAMLHDVVEDTPATLDEVRRLFGERVSQLVGWLTLPPDSKRMPRKQEYQLRMMREMNAEGQLIKIADKADNVLSMITEPPNWKAEVIVGYCRSAYDVVNRTMPLILPPGLDHMRRHFNKCFDDAMAVYNRAVVTR
jgi:(p)ppGpp synthase/HD superfamily hydrolase